MLYAGEKNLTLLEIRFGKKIIDSFVENTCKQKIREEARAPRVQKGRRRREKSEKERECGWEDFASTVVVENNSTITSSNKTSRHNLEKIPKLFYIQLFSFMEKYLPWSTCKLLLRNL